MKAIGRIYTDYNEKFSIPRQSGLVKNKGRIVFEKEYSIEEAFRGIEDYEYLWLLWEFSETKNKPWSPTVRPPRLGGNKRVGVFATRSPFRPNSIGMSSVKLIAVEKKNEAIELVVEGADILNGTPIYDIKPYIPYTDSHPDARCGFAEEGLKHKLSVEFAKETANNLPHDIKREISDILEYDPRPAYIDEEDRIYGMSYSGYDVRFRVNDGVAYVVSVENK